MNNKYYDSTPVQIDSGLRNYMRSIFNRMFFALGLTALVSYLCSTNEALLKFSVNHYLFLMIATFGVGIFLSLRIHKISVETANFLFWLYSALIGFAFSSLLLVFTGETIFKAFIATGVFFGGLSLYGYSTQKDLTKLGSFMTVGLFAIIISSLLNVFLFKSSAFELGLSAITVVVFCGLTAWDVQKLKILYFNRPENDSNQLSKIAIFGAFQLYLDFLNIFLALLRIFGSDRR